MQIWLIEEGQKSGPHPDYKIRQAIESGRYQSDTPAWHESLDEWTTLGEIAIFKSEFQPPKNTPPLEDSQVPANPPPSKSIHPGRRFWARVVDLNIHITFVFLFLYVANFNIGSALTNPWFVVLLLISWVPIETACLRMHGTTPGKWLLGIRVTRKDHGPLTRNQALWRSVRVTIAGVGLGLPVIMPICLIASYWITRRTGRTIWDHMGEISVQTHPLRLRRYILVAAILMLLSQLQFAVIAPYAIPIYQKQFPSAREHFQKNPPRHFPPRHPIPDDASHHFRFGRDVWQTV